MLIRRDAGHSGRISRTADGSARPQNPTDAKFGGLVDRTTSVKETRACVTSPNRSSRSRPDRSRVGAPSRRRAPGTSGLSLGVVPFQIIGMDYGSIETVVRADEVVLPGGDRTLSLSTALARLRTVSSLAGRPVSRPQSVAS